MKIASFNVGAFVKVTVSVFGALFLGAANFAKASGFDISCALPFDVIKVHHPIDDSCAKRGDVPDPPIGDNEAAHERRRATGARRRRRAGRARQHAPSRPREQ